MKLQTIYSVVYIQQLNKNTGLYKVQDNLCKYFVRSSDQSSHRLAHLKSKYKILSIFVKILCRD